MSTHNKTFVNLLELRLNVLTCIDDKAITATSLTRSTYRGVPEMTTAQAIKEMMAGWMKIEAEAKKQFPNATAEELYQICKSAMNHALSAKA